MCQSLSLPSCRLSALSFPALAQEVSSARGDTPWPSGSWVAGVWWTKGSGVLFSGCLGSRSPLPPTRDKSWAPPPASPSLLSSLIPARLTSSPLPASEPRRGLGIHAASPLGSCGALEPARSLRPPRRSVGSGSRLSAALPSFLEPLCATWPRRPPIHSPQGLSLLSGCRVSFLDLGSRQGLDSHLRDSQSVPTATSVSRKIAAPTQVP